MSFVDGLTLTVTIVESNSPPVKEGARIRQISEDQARLLFECEDDSTLDVTIVDPGELCHRSGQERSGRVSRITTGLVVESRSKRVIILDLSRIAGALDQQSGVG